MQPIIIDLTLQTPNSNGLTTTLTALDLGFNLAGKIRQTLWVNEDQGYITYSEIASKIANEYGLTPVVKETSSQHLRISQNTSDSQFLLELALKSVSKDGHSGYVFFIEDQELHFHPRNLEQKPFITLYYKPNDANQIGLISFSARIHSQGAKGPGIQTTAIGIDPRKKEIIKHTANNQNIRACCITKIYDPITNSWDFSLKQ